MLGGDHGDAPLEATAGKLLADLVAEGGVMRDQLSVLTTYKRSSRDACVQRLRERGLVAVGGDAIVATVEGIAALGSGFEPLPTGSALLAH